MKFVFCCLISIIAIFFSQSVGAQTVLFRSAGGAFDSYRAALQGASFRISPMDELERRLRGDELSPRLQQDLDETLNAAAREPAKAGDFFFDLYSRLELEPRSTAVRETLHSLLERLIPVAAQDRRTQLTEQLQTLKKMQSPASDLRLQNSLVQKEIQNVLRKIRQRPGGEDATLFWNGVRWNEQLPIETGTRAQWILLSSRWKPRLLVGPWSEISMQIDAGFQDWVSGVCEDPIYADVAFVGESRREAFFEKDCVAEKSNFKPTTKSALETASPGLAPAWKPVLWTGAITAAVLVLLTSSGKKLQLHR